MSKINYILLRKDVESTKRSVHDVSVDSGIDRAVLSKFLRQGSDMRALSLEHFAQLVDWLQQPADRYILRYGTVKADNEADELQSCRAAITRMVGTIGYYEGRLCWYEERDRATADWEADNPMPSPLEEDD